MTGILRAASSLSVVPTSCGVDRMGALVPAQFLRPDHRLIFAEVMCQIVTGRSCDVISVGMALIDKVDDAMAYLNAMAQSCPSAAKRRAGP